ncbi:MAG: hypothetical protein MRZ31_08660 [Dysosmobacter sp.]|jgi:hypothetical protein|uniref:hypothetical protein n=1 Tax=Dysosmobacter sp. TaxID=2591382 RepID=UPI0026736D48|nr:hypothetical protein [Dysosmobacter sp.]MCI6016750.1 hypothetical protein [Dysosmobacter sp.]
MKDSKERLGSVIYTYSGTDQEFDEFLKMMIHDYLAVDHPYSEQPKPRILARKFGLDIDRSKRRDWLSSLLLATGKIRTPTRF